MKKTILTLVTFILLFGLYSCNKDSSSTPAIGANQASFAGAAKDFSAYTSYSRSSANSISFTGGTSTNLNSGDNISLNLSSNNSKLTTGVYRPSIAANVFFSTTAKVDNVTYYSSWSDSSKNTITITSIDSLTINGSYNVTLYAQSDANKQFPKSLVGNFSY